MPVSLHWAQLLNKINLKYVPNTGNSRIGNQFADLTTYLDPFCLIGEYRTDLHDTACLHT